MVLVPSTNDSLQGAFVASISEPLGRLNLIKNRAKAFVEHQRRHNCRLVNEISGTNRQPNFQSVPGLAYSAVKKKKNRNRAVAKYCARTAL